MLTSLHLHKKSSEVSIKTRSTPASLSIQGQDTKHTTVKWPIEHGLKPVPAPRGDIIFVLYCFHCFNNLLHLYQEGGDRAFLPV